MKSSLIKPATLLLFASLVAGFVLYSVESAEQRTMGSPNGGPVQTNVSRDSVLKQVKQQVDSIKAELLKKNTTTDRLYEKPVYERQSLQGFYPKSEHAENYSGKAFSFPQR